MNAAGEVIRLGDAVTFRTGKLNSNAAVPDGAYPFFTCSQETFRTRTFSFDTEAVLLGGNNANGVYPLKYFKGKFDAYQRTYVIRAKDPNELDNRYLFYALQPELELLKSISTGAATKFLTLTILNEIRIPKRPILVQRRIADVLSAYDNLVENNTWRIKILEEMAQRIYREWFVDFRFPSHENVKMVESEMGLIPEGWKTGILRECCESMDYGYTARASKENIGPKFLRITDIVPDVIDWDSVPYCAPPLKGLEKHLVCEGDIVIARTGATTGYAKRLGKKHPRSLFASYLVRLRLKPGFSNHIIGVLVQSDDYKRFIKANWSGAAQPQANAQVLTSIPVIFPPTDLQHHFSLLVEPLFDSSENLQIKNRNLRTTRDLLLPRLISGEIPVEAADETAAELMERTA